MCVWPSSTSSRMRAQRLPPLLGVGRGLAAHQAHRGVDGHEPGARDEREAAEVQEQLAGAGVVQAADRVDDALERRPVQLAVERDDGDRRVPSTCSTVVCNAIYRFSSGWAARERVRVSMLPPPSRGR